MKAIILGIFVFFTGTLMATCDTISDTIKKQSVKQIDEHLVITDTVIIEHKINDIKTKIIDRRNYWIEISVFCLIMLSIINHYRKNKKNG